MYDFLICIHLQFLTDSSMHDLYKAHHSSKYKHTRMSVCMTTLIELFLTNTKCSGCLTNTCSQVWCSALTQLICLGLFSPAAIIFALARSNVKICSVAITAEVVAYRSITWTVWLWKYWRRRGKPVIYIQKAPLSKRNGKPELCSFYEWS